MKFSFGLYNPSEHHVVYLNTAHSVAVFLLGKRYKQWVVWLSVTEPEERIYPIDLGSCEGSYHQIEELCQTKLNTVWAENV